MKRRLACLGSVIIIAALGIGFSFQALVVYPLKSDPISVALIPRTNSDLGSDSGMYSQQPQPTPV